MIGPEGVVGWVGPAVGTVESGSFYRRPGGVFRFRRPDGSSLYKRPE